MRAYSMDLRQRVLAACDEGMATAEAAQAFAASPAWVRRLKQRRRQTGEVAPRRPARPGPAPALADHADRLRPLVRDRPGRAAAAYRDLPGVAVSPPTAWRATRRLGLTYKKSRSRRPSRAAPTSPRRGPPGGPS